MNCGKRGPITITWPAWPLSTWPSEHAERQRSACGLRLTWFFVSPMLGRGRAFPRFHAHRGRRSAPSALHPTARFFPAVDHVLPLTAGLPGSSSTLILLGLEL